MSNTNETTVPFLGQSDDQIFELCRSFDGRSAPLSSWTAEANWQGNATRFVSKLPSGLPLVYACDHGVQLNTELHDYEVNHNFRAFCTWNTFKFVSAQNSNRHNLKVFHIANPFALYWRCRGFKRQKNTKGTIVFLSHSGSGESYEQLLTKQYRDELKLLPAKFHPIVLCIHRNDVLNGCLTQVREICDFPVVTMGWAGRSDFGDRFYNTVSHFSYASSTDEMSALYYCVDFGIPFFLYGSRPILATSVNSERQSSLCYGLKHTLDLLFRGFFDEITPEQKHFCELVIGKSTRLDHVKFVTFVWIRLLSFSSIRRLVRYLFSKR